MQRSLRQNEYTQSSALSIANAMAISCPQLGIASPRRLRRPPHTCSIPHCETCAGSSLRADSLLPDLQEAKDIGDEFLALEKFVNLNYLVSIFWLPASLSKSTNRRTHLWSLCMLNMAYAHSHLSMQLCPSQGPKLCACAGLPQNPEEARQGAAACAMPAILPLTPTPAVLGAGDYRAWQALPSA